MADPRPFSIVRQPAWQALLRRLDAAVARDGRLLEARDGLLRPVELLRAMALDVPGALADDVLVADRLRALLFLAWPYIGATVEAHAVLKPKAGKTTASPTLTSHLSVSGIKAVGFDGIAWPPAQAPEPGVIDHAGLLLLMVACARVADPPFASVFLAAVHGLALSASAAEVLGRLDPRQPDASTMEIVLETLYLVDSARTDSGNQFLRPFILDPVERGRWHFLAELFGSRGLAKTLVDSEGRWDGATSHEIVDVSPRTAAEGELLMVTVDLPSDEIATDPPFPLFRATVVFASPEGKLLPATARVIDLINDETQAQVEVIVPVGAGPGWLGFSRDDLIEESNAEPRAAVRTALEEALKHPAIDGVGRIKSSMIPDLKGPVTPRRRALNRYQGSLPLVLFAGVSPARVRPGEHATLSWETAGADRVTVTVDGHVVREATEACGQLVLVTPPTDADLTAVVTPVREDGGAPGTGKPVTARLAVRAPLGIAGVDITQAWRAPRFEGRPIEVVVRLDGARGQVSGALTVDGRSGPPFSPAKSEPGRLTFSIPAALARDGLRFTVTVTDDQGARVTRGAGPVVLRAIRAAQVVLVRPSVLEREEHRIEAETAEARLVAAAGEQGLELSVVELPFAEDDLAVLVDNPAGDSDPALLRVLQGLERRALLTARFESALWLAFLPGANDLARWTPAYAARALAVATAAGLERLLREVYAETAAGAPVPGPVSGPHLAILGTIDDGQPGLPDGQVVIEEVRVDERGAGPGAAVATQLEVVSTDATGQELARHPVRVLSSARPARLALLVPVTADVASVELRARGHTLRVLARTRGTLSLEVSPRDPEVAPTVLDWAWKHTHNARPRVSLLLKRGRLSTPVHPIDPCSTRAELPLWRFAAADGLELYASDGWNRQVRAIGEGSLANEATAVLRKLSDGRFFADVPRGWEVSWRLDGQELGSDQRTLRLSPGAAGTLEFEARLGDSVLHDEREVRPGEAR